MARKNAEVAVEFSIGYPVFWKGHKFEIVALQGNNVVIYSETHKSDSALVVPRKEVEPIADEFFAIGDEVQSYHYFKGSVVGFEPENNRVVCITHNVNNPERDRVRYAYKPTELRKVDKDVAFKPNGKFFVKFAHQAFYKKVWTLSHPDNKTLITLYDLNDGKALITLPAEITTEDLLADFGIRTKTE